MSPYARKLLLILLAAAALYLVGNASVSLWDRDEPRYAQTSRQMLQSGDWVVPRFLDDVRTAKPVLIYWCQAASMAILGDNAFAARLPSAIAMLLTLGFLATVIRRWVTPEHALWTVFILATAGLAVAAAKMCITDAVLLLWVTIGQVCLLGIYAHAKNAQSQISNLKLAIVLWIAVGLGGLTKGPVVLGVHLATMLVLAAFDVSREWKSPRAWLRAIRWWRCTRPLLGLLMIAVICGPWLVLIHHRSPGFLWTSISHDVLGRARGAMEGHKGPPGYYLLTIWGTFFPWSLLLPAAIVIGWRHRRDSIVSRFCLAGVIGPWVMMELVQTKLAHYILPAFPPLAFLTADALVRCIRREHDDLTNRGFVIAGAVWAMIVAALGFAPWIVRPALGDPPPVGAAILCGCAILCAATAFGFIIARRLAPAAAAMGAGTVVVLFIVFALYLPRMKSLHLSERLGARLIESAATGRGSVVMIDYKEPSLAFYQGGTIREAAPGVLLKGKPVDWPAFVVLTTDVWAKLPEPVRAELSAVYADEGFAYADSGRHVQVMIVKRKH